MEGEERSNLEAYLDCRYLIRQNSPVSEVLIPKPLLHHTRWPDYPLGASIISSSICLRGAVECLQLSFL